MLQEGPQYTRLKRGRSQVNPDMRLSFKARVFVLMLVVVVTVGFISLVSVMSVKSKNRLRRNRGPKSHVKIQETQVALPETEKMPEMTVEEPNFDPGQLEAAYCNGDYKGQYHAVLFTTLPPHIDKPQVSIAENTFRTWSSLQPHIKPVLYVTKTLLKNSYHLRLVDTACREGFQVMYIPNSVKDQFPVLGFMFETSYRLFDVTWYGYADYKQIFDSSLYKALQMIESYPEIKKKGNLVIGRSHQFELDTESLSPDFPDLMDLGTLVQELYYFDATEEAVLSEDIHYYFTTRRAFPWGKLPTLIVNSDYLDKFLMWYTMKNTSILAVDATDAVFTLRQYYKHQSKNASEGGTLPMKTYNEALIGKWKHPLYYKKGLGTIKCLEFTLTNSEMPYYVLSRRTRKYIRRVTKTRPPTLSYYCKVVRQDRVLLVDNKGQVKDCPVGDQLNFLEDQGQLP